MNRLFFKFIFIIFCFCGSLLYAQNLIPDGGFEIWDSSIGSPPNTMSPLNNWYNANGTPDHHHQDNPAGSNLTSLQPCPTGNGNTDCGFPYEGKAVLGCWKGNGDDGTKEWAGTQLVEPMVAGGCYKVSFWVQNKKDNPDFYMATNQWGIFFSQMQIPFFSPDVADFSTMTDHFVMTEEVVQTSEWEYFEYDYQASEDFKYAYVGFMGNGSTSTNITWSDDFFIGFYAWFDDIIVERIDPMLELTEDVTLCLGDSLMINAESNFPVIWTDGVTIDSTLSFWVKPTESTTYYFQTQDSTQCSILDSVVVNVEGSEDIDFEADVLGGCPPFEVQFNDINPAQIATYEWDFGDGFFEEASFSTDHTYSESGIYDVTMTVTYFEDCVSTLTKENLIEVFEIPNADFDFTLGQSVNGLPEVQFSDQSEGNISEWFWDFGDGTSSFNQNPIHEYKLPGEYQVVLNVTTFQGCIHSITQTVFVSSELNFYIPNVFSPNGDGVNDRFEIFPFGQFENYKISIFDRWGGLMFESANPSEFWDGKNKNGQKAPGGIYTYMIEFLPIELNPKRKKLSGDVLILGVR
ncbi:MAG: PKD domain-containing protein [Bacteroidetes bacterium]|jgi:gliding motility-associated-like protein|nr:PKD domain-containing protein [Bacteroidota bacterium]MDF1864061.1 PKD domain-containing protein [Saprospiraceae bacterium]